MQAPKTYENFPAWIAILSNLVTLSIYAIGAYILAGFGILFAILTCFIVSGLKFVFSEEVVWTVIITRDRVPSRAVIWW